MKIDFEKQYEEDEKLEHILLKDIMYFDEEEDEYCDATLELFGHCTKTLTYQHDRSLWKGIKSVTSKKSEIKVAILQRDSKNTIIKIDDRKYIMPIADSELIIDFYNEINKEFINDRIAFKEKITDMAEDLFDKPNIYQIIHNYIDQIPFHFLMNFKLLAGFETLLERKDEIGKMLFLSTEDLRESIKKFTEHTEGKKTEIHEQIEGEDLIADYKKENFDLLVHLVAEELKIKCDSVAIYLTYDLLLEVAKRYFASSWEKEYGSQFSDITALSLVDATEIYCSIDTINHKSLKMAGAFIYYLMVNGKFDSDNYLECYDIMVDMIEECDKRNKLKKFGKRLRRAKSSAAMSIDAVDVMDGNEFEHFVAELFKRMGYDTNVTKASGDQGIDVIAEKEGRRLGIQAKCYSGAISNKAIQEVVAGLAHYRLDKGIVVTNNFFTDSARELAESNGIILWDRTMLKEKIAEFY